MPFNVGDRVVTNLSGEESDDWTEEALARRKHGMQGVIKKAHDSHGECYSVRHADGTDGTYDPHELILI